MLKEITERQQAILDFVKAYKKQNHGLAPTIREIMVNFGIKSPNGVNCTLRSLEIKGYIKRISKAARSIQILSADKEIDEELLRLLIELRQIINVHFPRHSVIERIDKYLVQDG